VELTRFIGQLAVSGHTTLKGWYDFNLRTQIVPDGALLMRPIMARFWGAGALWALTDSVS
jgi:hypothetical protein